MPTNPYLKIATSEQQLLESLIVESINAFGMDIMYLPRELQKEDLILGEDVLSKFTSYYEMPMYIKVFDRFGGEGDFLSKFGMQIEDTATLVVANSVFDAAVNGSLPYPREGDLIYFPLNKVMMEIKFVEDEVTFYQLGRVYMFELRCEMFRYTNERITTGEPEIDQAYLDKIAFAVDVQLAAGGTGTFSVGESVYQGASLGAASAQAEVISWDVSTRILRVKYLVGEFSTTGGTVKGNTSGAIWTFTSADYQDNTNSEHDDNAQLEEEAETVVDDDESNPFGNF